jgi:hypothetical protein
MAAQTLTVLSALSTPPVLTEANALMANVAAINNLDNRQLLALRVLALAYALNDGGGTDYRTNFPLLIESATNLFGGNAINIIIPPYNSEIAGKIEAVLDWNAGYTADNTLSTDVDTLVAEMGILRQLNETQLLRIIFFLKWKIA